MNYLVALTTLGVSTPTYLPDLTLAQAAKAYNKAASNLGPEAQEADRKPLDEAPVDLTRKINEYRNAPEEEDEESVLGCSTVGEIVGEASGSKCKIALSDPPRAQLSVITLSSDHVHTLRPYTQCPLLRLVVGART